LRRLLDEEDAQVRTERALLTVMFTDLTGFTTFSDGADPEMVTATLNAYLDEMVRIVEAHGGVVDKVMGDGIMAIWGAPDPLPADAQAHAAVAARLEMQACMASLTAGWREAGIQHPFRIRVGIHQDNVAVGSIGSDALRTFTAIGGGANLASRLEGACPPGAVLVSWAVARWLPPDPRRQGPIPRTLKGLRAPVETWELHPDGTGPA
jgi:class 3 adenylate cyclase